MYQFLHFFPLPYLIATNWENLIKSFVLRKLLYRQDKYRCFVKKYHYHWFIDWGDKLFSTQWPRYDAHILQGLIKSAKPLKMSHKLLLQVAEPLTTQIKCTKLFEKHLRSYCSSAFVIASLCIALARLLYYLGTSHNLLEDQLNLMSYHPA